MHEFTTPRVHRLVDFGLLEQAPRASMSDVEAQLFPLLADRRRLQNFLDRHFNDTLARCSTRLEAVSPIVLFALLYYPTMHGFDRAEASVLEQDEYYFLVPVRCHYRIGGRDVVKTGVVTPYIYVSSAISTPVGRELYGWQKALYRVSKVAPRGARLTKHEPYLDVERPVPGRRGEGLEYRRVLQLTYRNDASPIRLGGTSSRLLEVLDEIPTVAALAFRTFLGEIGGDSGVRLFPDQLVGVAELLRDVLHPDEELSVFSLVQFPHPSLGVMTASGTPSFAAAYQALNRSELRVRNIRELALLGSSPAGLLDPSRGFALRLSGYGVDQVVTRLGLQVWASECEEATGQETQIVHPFFPISARFDLEVPTLETLARRTAKSDWLDGAGAVIGVRPEGTVSAYNTFLGPSSAEGFTSYGRVRQVQQYRLFGMRVPLAPLAELCHQLAPTPPGMTITPRVVGGDGVVAIAVTRLPPSDDPYDRLEWFSGNYVNICIVADISYQGRTRIVFLETHGFTDNPHAFVVGRELLAANRWVMEVDESPQPWIPARADRGRHMLSVSTDTLRTLNAGDRVQMSPLLDIVECDDPGSKDASAAQRRLFAPHIDEVFADRRFAYARVDSIPMVGPNGDIGTALVRCNVELVYFAPAGDPVEPPTWLGRHELFVYPYESIPLVRQLGLRTAEQPVPEFVRPGGLTPQCVSCDVALGGEFPAARRGLLTLYEWTVDGWSCDMIEQFFSGPSTRSSPQSERDRR